ncbi:MAG TPA: hypothetical protein VK619_06095 [Pyrinomonadaceae bacterium]|nr:hypothetical protein [Pyrinomonadaceae bacterium]
MNKRGDAILGRLLAKIEPLRRWIDGYQTTGSLQALNSQPKQRRVDGRVSDSRDVRGRLLHESRGVYAAGLPDLHPQKIHPLPQQGR